MSAISSLSFNRPTSGASLQSQIQRAPVTNANAARGNVNTAAAARGGNVGNSSAAYCPTCNGGAGAARGSANASSSYCPTCNQAGGAQSNVRGGQSFQFGQGGQSSVASAYRR